MIGTSTAPGEHLTDEGNIRTRLGRVVPPARRIDRQQDAEDDKVIVRRVSRRRRSQESQEARP